MNHCHTHLSSFFIDSQELNSSQQLGNKMIANQPNGDFKIFPEDIYDAECHNNYVDSLQSEVNNSFITDSPDQDWCAEVKEAHLDSGFGNTICLGNTRTDKDNKVEFSADENYLDDKRSGLQESSVDADGNAIKDICVNDGGHLKVKIHVGLQDIDEGLRHGADNIYSTESEELSSNNQKVDANWPVSVGLKSLPDVGCEKDLITIKSEVLVNKNGSKNETKSVISSDPLKEKDADTFSIEITALDDSQLKTSIENECRDEQDVGYATNEDSLTEHGVACDKSVASGTTPQEINVDSTVETSDEIELGKESTNESSFLTSVNNYEVEHSLIIHRQMPAAAGMPPL